METAAVFLIISLLASQTLFSTNSIVSEARPLLPIMENPKNSLVENIYNSGEGTLKSRPLPSPPPPPKSAPPPIPPKPYYPIFKFMQDLFRLYEKFPSYQLLFTTPSVKETRPFQLILSNQSTESKRILKINPMDLERPGPSPPPPPSPAPHPVPKPKSPASPYELQVA